MKKLRPFVTIMFAVVALHALPGVAGADGPNAKDALLERMDFYDKIFTTPPTVSLEQRWLQIATIAAFESGQDDAGIIMEAFLAASASVTYYLHADSTYMWDGSQWVVIYRTLYAYTDGNLTETLEQDLNESGWVNTGRTLMTYDGSDRVATQTFEMWQAEQWVPLFKFVYSYTGGGLLNQLIQQAWTGSAWVDQTRSTASYSGTKVTTQLTENWTGAAWVADSRILFTYSGDNLTESLTQDWNGTSWVNYSRTTNTYSGSNVTQSIYQTWNGSDWVNVDRSDYTYDGQNRETVAVGYNWISNAWSYSDSDSSKYSGNQLSETVRVTFFMTIATVTRTLLYYDGAGNLIEDVSSFDFFGTLINSTRTTYYYSTSGVFDNDAATGIPSSFTLSQNYPNPFNMSTRIPYSLAGDSHVKITVSNILGQTVATVVDEFQMAGPQSALWEGRNAGGTDVASGVYFFRVQVGTASQVRKMVLLK